MISHEDLLKFYKYDPETGLIWSRRHGHPIGSRNVDGYIKLKLGNGTAVQKGYLAHRIAVYYMIGIWPQGPIDHKNKDRSDNRWVNLEVSTPQRNAARRSCTYGMEHDTRIRAYPRARSGVHPFDPKIVLETQQRNLKIFNEVLSGVSMAEVGRREQLTRQRILQICQKVRQLVT